MNITAEWINTLQIAFAVCAGGFIGEFNRTATEPVTLRIFMANFLAGSFLSFFVAYLVYHMSNNKTVSVTVGGLLSYQDEKFINKIVKFILLEIKKIPVSNGGNNNHDKEE